MVPREVDVPLIDVAVAPEAMEEDRPAEEPEGPVGDGEISVQVEIPEKVIIEDLELTATSSVHDPRRICRYFGINQSGSKRKMYERIVKCHVVALRRRALDLAEQQYRDEMVDPVDAGVRVREPTLRERRLHELTHLPFQQWCPHCVSCKSRPDHQRRVDPSDAADGEHPTIQIDLMFGITGGPILIMVDVWSRYVKAIPMKTKSANGIAESLVTFIGELGHMQTVEVAHDNEPVVNVLVLNKQRL